MGGVLGGVLGGGVFNFDKFACLKFANLMF